MEFLRIVVRQVLRSWTLVVAQDKILRPIRPTQPWTLRATVVR